MENSIVSARYARLFSDLPTATFVISPSGLIVEANRAAARIAKWNPDTLKGQSLESWIAPRSKGIWTTFLQRVQSDQEGHSHFCEVHTLGLLSETGDGLGFFRADGTRNEDGSELCIALNDITSARAGEQLARLGHWHWSLATNIVTWSDEVYRLKGADPASYVPSYQGLAALYTPENWAKLQHAVEQCVTNRISYELDLETHCFDGSFKWISARGEPLIGVDGVVTGLHGTVQDVTERKNLEAALHQRQQIWRQAEAIGQLGGWERDLLSGRMVVSDGYVHLLGAPHGDITFDEWRAYIHPEDVNHVLTSIESAMVTGSMTLEYRIRRGDGAVRVLFAQGRVTRDDTGKPVRTYGVVQDITERKELEAALTKRRQMWTEAEKIGRLGGLELDILADRLTLSDGLAAILGCGRRVYSSSTILQFVHPDDVQLVQARIYEATVLGHHGAFESRVRREDDGVERVVQVHWRVVSDDSGKPIRLFGAVQDITERKRSEQALEETMRELTIAKAKADEALRAKGLFLAAMSHEIRTPLNSVIGLSNLLSDSNLDDQQRDFIDTIRTSGELLLAVVNDILDYSKLEEGKVQAERIPFDLRTAAEDVIRVVSQTATSKGLDLRLEFEENFCTFPVTGDPGRLKQVLLNLLSNAVKFTSIGSVTLQVEPAGLDQVRFKVVDTGIGIPATSQAALFEFFTQADSSTTRRFGGTGLGLAISRRLVHLFGGTIGVKSEANVGSTFWFTANLPATSTTTSVEPGSANLLPSHLVGKRALVVDFDGASATRLVLQLNRLGMRASAVESAQQARSAMDSALIAGDPITFVFVDPAIPDGGWKLAETIRQQPWGREVAIFAVSSTRPKRHRIECALDSKRVAHEGFLLKPIPDRILIQALRRLPASFERLSVQKGSEAAPRRVLVVEDNRVNQKVAAASLERLGCQVDIAQDGFEAVSFFENMINENSETVYDIILMDCHMPGMDGFAATMEIRKLEAALQPDHRRIPIVALTADVLESGLDRCIQSGMDDFLSKPLRLSALEAAFRRWIPDKV